MSIEKKKAAVIGLGIGMAHVAGYLESEYAELAAVCDLMPGRLATVGGTFEQGSMLCLKPLFKDELLGRSWEDIGVRTTDSMDSILEDPEIDIVSICTPDYLHAGHLKRVMASGKHIMLEKPVAITMEDAHEIGRLAEAYGKQVCIGYEFRMNPVVRQLKQIVDSGRIGRVEAFSLYHFRTPFRRDKWNHWIQQREFSGGLIIEETCHWFDLARFITSKEIGTIHCVTASGVHDDFDFEDVAYIQGRYEDGGIFQVSHALTGFDFSLQLTVHGTDGTAWAGMKEEAYSSLDNGATDYLGIVSVGKPGDGPKDAEVTTYGEEATEPFNIREMVKEFCRAIAAGEPVTATVEDGIRSLAASVAALESAGGL